MFSLAAGLGGVGYRWIYIISYILKKVNYFKNIIRNEILFIINIVLKYVNNI